jgi:hypothetical protein
MLSCCSAPTLAGSVRHTGTAAAVGSAHSRRDWPGAPLLRGQRPAAAPCVSLEEADRMVRSVCCSDARGAFVASRRDEPAMHWLQLQPGGYFVRGTTIGGVAR